jgi:DNA-binding SARP family transcriptional activator
MRLELYFLGIPKLVVDGVPKEIRRQHALALLAYLALEPGFQARERLATMLWANADTISSQQNLRTALAHLRDVLGETADLLETTRSKMQLLPTDVWIDVLRLRDAKDSELETVAKLYQHDFLSTLQLPDAPEFEFWLEQLRERSRNEFDLVLTRLFEQQSQAALFTSALETARRRVNLNSFNESAHQDLMQLLLEQGNRVAALEVFRVLENKLKIELGLSPNQEISNLATQIQKLGDVVTAVAEPFVARVEEWQTLEKAWRKGQRVLLRGEPGVGKTRLLREFARACGSSVWLEGRPGDQSVPFAAVTRFLRAHQIKQLELPTWVKSELHALLPEIEGISSLTQNKQRLFSALLECFELICKPVSLLVLDDWQFLDPSSLKYIFFLLEQSNQAIVATARSAELNSETEKHIATLIGTQRLVQIELPRLKQSELENLLRALNLDTKQAELLHKRTGGNPLYALESVRAGVAENKQLTQLIEARLDRLSKPARDVARVAAITEREFGLELTAQILEVRELELLEPIDELQQHNLMLDMRFAHDMVLETLRENMPLTTRRWLHQRALAVLEQKQVSPAILAFHAIKAAKPVAVLRHSAVAGARAVEVYAYTEALEHQRHGLLALFELSDAEAANIEEQQLITFFDAYATLLTQQSRFAELHDALHQGIEQARLRQWTWLEGALHNLGARALLRAGTDLETAEQMYLNANKITLQIPQLELDTLLTRHHLEGAKGNWALAEESARAAAQQAVKTKQPELLQEALMGALFAEQNLGAWEELRITAEEVRPISEQVGGRASLAHGWAVSAIASVYLGQPRRAILEAENAFTTLSSIGWGSGQRFAAQALTQAHAELGELEKALEFNAPTVFHENAATRPAAHARSWLTRAQIYFWQFDTLNALAAVQQAKQIVCLVMPCDAFQIRAYIASFESAIQMQNNNQTQALASALEAQQHRNNHILHGWTRWTPHWLEIRALCLGQHSNLAEKRITELHLLETNNPRWKIEVLAAEAELQKPKAAHKSLTKAIGIAQQLELPLRLRQLEQQKKSLMNLIKQ